ncbi:MAG: carbohydrate porin [Lactobacillus sp.]|jgi:hypothetical protein|nr:carbohydrate porin [Lactobacillus sp.]
MKKLIFAALAITVLSPAAAFASTYDTTTTDSKPEIYYKKYKDFKEWLEKDYGFTYNVAISLLAQRASPSGSITPLQVQYTGDANWEAFQSDYGNGSFQVAYTSNRYIGHRNAYQLGERIGAASDINDYSVNLNYFYQLSYTHQLPGAMEWMSVTVGQFPIFLFDDNPYLSNQQLDFNNLSYSQNATYSYPTASFGAYVTMNPTEEVTAVVGFQDAHNIASDKIKTGTIRDGSYTTFASLVYEPHVNGLGKGYYGVMVYNQPKVREQPNESYGWSLSLAQDIGDKWAVFSRINGVNKSVILKESYSFGAVYKDPFDRNDMDRIGFVAGINKINKDVAGDDARDMETVMEAYLNYTISDCIVISPDLQYYIKPALNRKNDEAFVYGLRATLLF